MRKTRNLGIAVVVFLMMSFANFVIAPVQAVDCVVLDNMNNIFGAPGVDRLLSPWTDAGGPCWMSQAGGAMKIDFGVTYDGVSDPALCNPHPDSGWDYLGNWVGVGGPGGAFDEFGFGGNPGTPGYLGAMDRAPSGDFGFAIPPNFAPLVATHAFQLDVYKTVAFRSEHVREIQIYDSLGSRNTYTVQAEATVHLTPAGWKTYTIPLSSPNEDNADLTDIVTVRLWVTSWATYVFQNFENPTWPGDYIIVQPTGTPVLIDNLQLCLLPTVLVPDVYNMTESAAEAALVAADLVKGSVTTDYNDIVPIGNVMSQNPLAATSVPIGSSVSLVLSLGHLTTTLYVDDDAPGDPAPGDPSSSDPLEDGSTAHPYDAIQEAINAAFDSDTVVVLDGTYTGTGNRDIDYGGRAITIRSQNGPDGCIIDCQQQGRGFYFHTGEDGNSVLDGLTITNGSSDDGGGIFCENSSPTITGCTFSGNSADDGGGMYNYDNSSPTVTNCTFSNNTTASGDGGGMYNQESSPTVTNCTFSGNSADDGGGMCNYNSSSPTVTNCTFSNNSADWGGGMENWLNSSPTVTNCTFSNNSASFFGGGMSNNGSSTPTVSNCTFSGNSAVGGGGMCNYDSDPTAMTVTNCILWDNTAVSGGNEIALLFSSTIDVNYCDIKDGNDGIYNNGGTINWGSGNSDADPMFFDANNPDPNLRDYHLQPGSPCIDTGDNNSIPADTADLDNDGNTAEPIPFDIDTDVRVSGGIVDMGSDEVIWDGAAGIAPADPPVTLNPGGGPDDPNTEPLVVFDNNMPPDLMLDNMNNIAARPWTNATGSCWISQAGGAMKIDYGVTNIGSCVPHSLSGWDYLGNWVGVGGPGGAFGNPGLGGIYYGESDIAPSGPFAPGVIPNLAPLVATYAFLLDVYKTVAGSPEHVREIQLYDNLGNRSTYTVQAEATAKDTPQGWKTYTIPLSSPNENNADLSNIVTIKLWVSSWSAYVFQNFEDPTWPDDYTIVQPTGTPVFIDDLQLVSVSAADITVVEISSDPHPPSGGFEGMGTTLRIETNLADGQFFMTVVIPFDGNDLDGQDPLLVDLMYYDSNSSSYILAVAGNTGPVGIRWVEQDPPDAPPTLATLNGRPLGDYGVYWKAATQTGYVWANVDHTTDFGSVVWLRGDTEPDGDVDLVDFSTFGLYWGQTGCGVCGKVDLTGDGNVGPDDLRQFIGNWLVGL